MLPRQARTATLVNRLSGGLPRLQVMPRRGEPGCPQRPLCPLPRSGPLFLRVVSGASAAFLSARAWTRPRVGLGVLPLRLLESGQYGKVQATGRRPPRACGEHEPPTVLVSAVPGRHQGGPGLWGSGDAQSLFRAGGLSPSALSPSKGGGGTGGTHEGLRTPAERLP